MAADNMAASTGAPQAVTTAVVVIDEKQATDIQKSQADYKGNSHFDLVEVEIIKDGDFYKKGDKDRVHPSLAAILKQKGLISSYKGEAKKD